jgi:SAM-dependent methyltransferase
MGALEQLPTLDWREAWKEQNRIRREPNPSTFWDGRAREFSLHAGSSPYTNEFIERLGLRPGQTVLDIGAGSGTLALPLARDGHGVFAVDFSPGMLDALERSARQEGLDIIRTALLDFNAPWEDWEAAGITENSVDIAIASRSTMVKDLREAFEKLEHAACEKVAVTVATEYGPRGIRRMGESFQGIPYFIPDYIFAVNILFQMNRYPCLSFIDCPKSDEDGESRLVRWAFISWNAGGIPT